jgi:hypothetical protein
LSLSRVALTDAIRPAEIAKTEFDNLKTLFGDEKLARQILNAAKRVSKKRAASDMSTHAGPTPAAKKPKPSYGMSFDPASYEESLALPEVQSDVEDLKEVVVHTNRAPLLLAFAVTLLKYTMPEQPLSSRLSLAQAVCSANSQSKAKYIGIQVGTTADEEGWGEGQPLVTVIGRQIQVMKRWGYEWKKNVPPTSTQGTLATDEDSQLQETMPPVARVDTDETVITDTRPTEKVDEEPALWGVDLEALKNSNGPVIMGERKTSSTELPIYKPEGTRAYLLKAFETKKTKTGQQVTGKKATIAKEHNLGMLLHTLELLHESWALVLSKNDLNKRAWGWYVNVRPDVKPGAAGWGGKGDVALSDILNLRRPAG